MLSPRLLIIKCIICNDYHFLTFRYVYPISQEISMFILVSITVSDSTLIDVFDSILPSC